MVLLLYIFCAVHSFHESDYEAIWDLFGSGRELSSLDEISEGSFGVDLGCFAFFKQVLPHERPLTIIVT